MKFDNRGTADKCERILRSALYKETDISIHKEERLRRALSWHRGNLDDNLSLPEWLAVLRHLGDVLAVRLDNDETHHFLKFDHDRNRVIYVDPTADSHVPVEETNIMDIFEESAVSIVPSDEIKPKTFEVLSAVTNPDHGTRLLYGEYTDGVNWITDEDQEVEFTTQATFSLPRPMTIEEINRWIKEKDIMKIIEQNHEQDWGSKMKSQKPPD